MDKITRPILMQFIRDSLWTERHTKTKIKGMKNIFNANENLKR